MTKRLDYRTASPDGIKALLASSSYIQDCGLPAALLELVYLRCSQINGCAFCIDMHSQNMIKKGVPLDKLMLVSVWREARELFSQEEQAALMWAERVTKIADAAIDDSEYDAARKVFSEKELVDLTIAIGLINAYNRLGISFNATPISVHKYERTAATH